MKINFERTIEVVCWGAVLGLLLHMLIQQAGTMLTIAASVGS